MHKGKHFYLQPRRVWQKLIYPSPISLIVRLQTYIRTYVHTYIQNKSNKILDIQANIYMSHDQACLFSVSNPLPLIKSGMLADRSTTPAGDNIPTTCNKITTNT